MSTTPLALFSLASPQIFKDTILGFTLLFSLSLFCSVFKTTENASMHRLCYFSFRKSRKHKTQILFLCIPGEKRREKCHPRRFCFLSRAFRVSPRKYREPGTGFKTPSFTYFHCLLSSPASPFINERFAILIPTLEKKHTAETKQEKTNKQTNPDHD